MFRYFYCVRKDRAKFLNAVHKKTSLVQKVPRFKYTTSQNIPVR